MRSTPGRFYSLWRCPTHAYGRSRPTDMLHGIALLTTASQARQRSTGTPLNLSPLLTTREPLQPDPRIRCYP
jgi:hypothetical protein